jgi:hypothetical protein
MEHVRQPSALSAFAISLMEIAAARVRAVLCRISHTYACTAQIAHIRLDS